MKLLVLRAYLKLIYVDLHLARGNFAELHKKVRTCPVGRSAAAPGITERICAAVDMATILYWKQVLCLQRSAATACLLRKYGVTAHMMIGVQQLPFKAHAWVEVGGRVVNDKPYTRDIYEVLDQC